MTNKTTLPVAGYTDLQALAKNGEDGYPYEYLTQNATTKRCTALTPRDPAQAIIDQLRAERDAAVERAEFMFRMTRDAQEIASNSNDRWAAAQKELAALKAAQVAPVAGGVVGWQPIETAPRHGRILVWGDLHMGRCVASAGWRNETPDVIQWEVVNGIIVNPTHWMPLPAAPQAAQKEGD